MSSDRKTIVKFDFGFMWTLGTIFVVLKLAAVSPFTTWSWWWVLAPFWIGLVAPFVLVALFLVVGAVVAFIATLLLSK